MAKKDMPLHSEPRDHNFIDVDGKLVGQASRIIAAGSDGLTFHFQNATGQTGRFTVNEPCDLRVGQVVLIGDSRAEPAPEEIWNEPLSIGVVRKLLEAGVLIEGGLTLKVVENYRKLDVQPGYTVSYGDLTGISQVISQTPIRVRDFGVEEEDAADKYRVDTTGWDLGFEDFGGYHDVVSRAKELVETQLNHKKELDAIGARAIKGVMFSGPPGTGKTLLARIIAYKSGAAFFLVSGPSIVSKWVGDSEETLRRIFDAASRCERAIIFFDEIDSLAEKRSGDSHEASKRLVAQLLTLMDGFDQSGSNVVVIAATNRIRDIDAALMRPGRFDWEIEFGLPELADRVEILEASMKSLQVRGDMPVLEIASRTGGWSAAQVASLWTEAALLAASDSRDRICDEDLVEGFERVQRRVLTHLEEGAGDE